MMKWLLFVGKWGRAVGLAAIMCSTACSHALQEPVVRVVPREDAAPEPGMVPVTSKADLEALFERIGDRRFVLLGESTHGTHEYYKWRDRISRRLIRERGFRFVAVEGDWDSISRLNRYVKHRTSDDTDLQALLRGLDRWPRWMWANEEFAGFLRQLREKNASRPDHERVGVYGLDMQDPQASLRAVTAWVGRHAAERRDWVDKRYAPVSGTPDGFRQYARRLAQGGERLRGNFVEVADWLQARHAETPDDPDLFSAKMNALALVSAEAQYTAMVRGGPDSWNVRARFMHKAFQRLAARYGDDSRGIVWAHNTHVGDARATEMLSRGEVNIGQLLREAYDAEQVYILGFATSGGTVVAGAGWGRPMQVMEIAPHRPGSLEEALAGLGHEQGVVFFDALTAGGKWNEARPHRAIGVVYQPPHEAYVMTVPARRYDALFYIRETRALTPVN